MYKLIVLAILLDSLLCSLVHKLLEQVFSHKIFFPMRIIIIIINVFAFLSYILIGLLFKFLGSQGFACSIQAPDLCSRKIQ